MMIRCKYLRPLLLLLLLVAAVLSFSACSSNSDAAASIWVVTEETDEDGMNQQVRQVIKAFQADHPDVTVTLDILPTDSSQREIVLKQLRTKIMAGDGPDVYLLPSCNTYRYATKYWAAQEAWTLPTQVEPLFLAPSQVMRRGVFLDIGGFYDSDTELKTEQLQQDVMAAGTLDGGRYLLPLRYDFPVLYADAEGLQSLGLELDGSWGNLADAALALGSPVFANGAKPDFCQLGSVLTLLPAALDYEYDTVTLTEEDLLSFLTRYSALLTLSDGHHDEYYGPSLFRWIHHGTLKISPSDLANPAAVNNAERIEWEIFPRDVSIIVGTMSQAPIAATIMQAEEKELLMIPLTDDNGKLTADVTYYGALGAGCRNPELGYDLLRRFLLEENQWEQNRTLQRNVVNKKLLMQYHPIANGWPVRNHGWLEGWWGYVRNSIYKSQSIMDGDDIRSKKLRLVELTDDDIPILDAKIDRVSFGNTVEQEIATLLRQLRDGEAGDADLEAQAAQFLRELRWQITEG